MSDLGAALVVFGVIGYVVLRHCCHRSRFRWDALEWQQNVFESTAAGLALFATARLAMPLVRLIAGNWRFVRVTVAFLKAQFAFPYPGTVLLGTAIGFLVAVLTNLRWPPDRALDAAIRFHGGSLRILLHDANRTNRSVMLTLSNRKVYVGWVFTPPPIPEPSHVVLFPTLSGHRSNEKLQIEWTTNYSSAYEDIIERKSRGEKPATDLEHFQLVLPLDEVVSATYFDIDLYHRHFAPPEGQEGGGQ
jgi:hypothetical protein